MNLSICPDRGFFSLSQRFANEFGPFRLVRLHLMRVFRRPIDTTTLIRSERRWRATCSLHLRTARSCNGICSQFDFDISGAFQANSSIFPMEQDVAESTCQYWQWRAGVSVKESATIRLWLDSRARKC